jgi:hypothetical protein
MVIAYPVLTVEWFYTFIDKPPILQENLPAACPYVLTSLLPYFLTSPPFWGVSFLLGNTISYLIGVIPKLIIYLAYPERSRRIPSGGVKKFYTFFQGLLFFSGKIFFIAPATTKIKIKAAAAIPAQAVPLIFNIINIHTSLKIYTS